MSLLASLQNLFLSQEKDALFPFREKAWEKFLGRGFPEKKDEAFQHVSLRTLMTERFEPVQTISIAQEEMASRLLPECAGFRLVFVNGEFSKELSNLPKQLVLLRTADAMRTYGHFLQSRLTRRVEEEKDPFALLAGAFSSGYFLYVPPKTQLKAPIQCLHLTCQNRVLSFPALNLFVGKEAEVELVVTRESQQSHLYWQNELIDCTLDERARLKWVDVQLSATSAWQFCSFRATLKRDSHLEALSFTKGGAVHRHNICATLQGENAEVSLGGLWELEKNRTAHTHVLIEHVAPHTRSQQLFKGVLKESSQSSFTGKILVTQEAQKTEAYQLNNNLLLGNSAIANSKPNLEIFADDVKASHGATVAKLDPALLFYLKTRGVSDEESKKLLTQAFCRAVTDRFAYESFKEELCAHS